jgi:hypothetical protein
MANAQWPSTLPPPLADSSAAYGAPNNVIETPMDSGGPKMRRRTTSVELQFSCTLRLSTAQNAILETFYYNTLKQVLPFDWIDFRTGVACTYRFTADGYRSSYVQGTVDRWQAVLSLARKP